MHQLHTQLKEFKLAGMSSVLEERINHANANKLSYREFLELLCEDELNNRRVNNYNKRFARAKFPVIKRLEDFDFDFQPSIDKRLLNDIATCHFIKVKKSTVFIGNPGTGKTHLAVSLGMKALAKDYIVFHNFIDSCKVLVYNDYYAKNI